MQISNWIKQHKKLLIFYCIVIVALNALFIYFAFIIPKADGNEIKDHIKDETFIIVSDGVESPYIEVYNIDSKDEVKRCDLPQDALGIISACKSEGKALLMMGEDGFDPVYAIGEADINAEKYTELISKEGIRKIKSEIAETADVAVKLNRFRTVPGTSKITFEGEDNLYIYDTKDNSYEKLVDEKILHHEWSSDGENAVILIYEDDNHMDDDIDDMTDIRDFGDLIIYNTVTKEKKEIAPKVFDFYSSPGLDKMVLKTKSDGGYYIYDGRKEEIIKWDVSFNNDEKWSFSESGRYAYNNGFIYDMDTGKRIKAWMMSKQALWY